PASTYGRGLWRIPLVAKAVQMTWPNGFEVLPAASHQVVRWAYDGPETGRINLDLMKDGEVLVRIAENVPAWHEEFDWTVPEDVPLESDYAIRAVTLDEAPSSDTSDGEFGIVEAERISVAAPNGGETLSLGQSTEIRWAHTGAIGSSVRVELLRDGGLVRTIAEATPIGPKEGMAYAWTVPTNLTVGPGYTVRVGSVDKPDAQDTSDAPFSVAGADTLTITDPNGGELWAPGSEQTIRWAFTGRPGSNVSLALLKSGLHVLDIVASAPVGVGDKGHYDWTVDFGLAPGVDYAVRIASTTKPDIQDDSDFFGIGVDASQLVTPGVDAEHAGPVTLWAWLHEMDGDPISGRTVAFEVNGAPVGQAQTDASGSAQLPITLSPDLTPGDWPLRASFAGDGSYAAATSDAVCTVHRSATSLVVPSGSGTVGAHAEVSATLNRLRDGAPLAGARLTFRLDGADVGTASTDAAGRATCMFRVRENEEPGERVMEAVFDGDSVNEPSAGVGTFVVELSPTAVRPADAVGSVGAPITLTADLIRTSDGLPLSGRLLRFEIEGSHIGDATTGPNGVAALTFQVPDTLPPTQHSLLVSFAGDSGHLASSGTAVVDIVPADTTLYTIDRTGTITGLVILRQFDLKRLTDNALLEGKTVSFRIDGTEVGTGVTNAGGDSTLNWIVTDGPATRTITAAFAGDAAYNGCADDA
ncbi:MAG: hypothetical protein FJX72_18820, partial [Armatimonadetes bacterium]|nr:hypothetical protein [Armatimonadota bacterium]